MPHKQYLSALLAKGYFPKELPTTFTTETFGRHSPNILDDWKKANIFKTKDVKVKGKGRLSGSYCYELTSADPEFVSMPKRGYERRNLAITHPIPQTLLSLELAKNWRTIQKWLTRQRFSLDRIRISENYVRSIKGLDFDTHHAKQAYIDASSDWLVRTDITRFYPTIYTHSIPWAAYGKERVKSELASYKGSLADRIDILVRACNRNQTIGIPIGPETSRIIAEIVSSRIDTDFQNKLKEIPRERIDRLQDDWFVGVETQALAENVLSTINTIYRDYGLEINGSKTNITHTTDTARPTWASELGGHLLRRAGAKRSIALQELFSLAFRLQEQHPDAPVVNYVVAVMEGQQISSEDTAAIESFLLKAAVVSPKSMDRICQLLLNVQHRTKQISIHRITERFRVLAERSLSNGHHFEAIWLIHTLRGLRSKLNSKEITELSEITPSSALALLLLDMKSMGLIPLRLPKSEWERRISKDSIRSDWSWLLAYEGIRHGWLADRSSIMNDPFFKAMHARNVTFYDERRNVIDTMKLARIRAKIRKERIVEVQKLIERMRGFQRLIPSSI